MTTSVKASWALFTIEKSMCVLQKYHYVYNIYRDIIHGRVIGYMKIHRGILKLAWTGKTQRLPPRRRISIEHRLLRKTRHASSMTRLQALVIIGSIVHRDSAARMSALEHHWLGSAATHLLSHSALEPGVQLKRTWISTLLSYTLYRYCKIASLSPSSRPTMRLVMARFTYRLFQPVTGCTRTIGWLRSTYLGPALGSSRSR